MHEKVNLLHIHISPLICYQILHKLEATSTMHPQSFYLFQVNVTPPRSEEIPYCAIFSYCFITHYLLLHSALFIAVFWNIYCFISHYLLLHFPLLITAFLIIYCCIPHDLLLHSSWFIVELLPIIYCCIF